jgi:hypothetical protein
MAKTVSEVSKASRARSGSKSTSFAFTTDELAQIDRLAKRYGGKKAALVAGLNALECRNELSKAELLAALDRAIPD